MTRRGVPEPWQRRASTQLLAALIGVGPLYCGLILFHLRRQQPITTQGFVVYLGVICPIAIVLVLVLLRWLCGENPGDLNLRPGKVSSDLLAALILCVVIVVANVASHRVLAGLLPGSSGEASAAALFLELARDPELLVLFLGLLIPLGAASEEVVRVFLLSRLWKVWPSATGKLAAVVVSACLFGLTHHYRGPTGVAWGASFGLIMAVYYFRSGRVVPLVLAHFATNALQVTLFAARSG